MIEFELVLPCFNESPSLLKLIERAVNVAESEGYTPDRFKIVIVENGSTDNSAQILEELKSGIYGVWFRVVSIPVNRGYGFGVWSGLISSPARYLAWSHADEQCDPKDAFTALYILRADSTEHVLIKSERSGRKCTERAITHLFEWLAQVILKVPYREINAQPKVFRRELLQEIICPPCSLGFDLYFLYCAAKAGYIAKTFSVVLHPRKSGKSNWSNGLNSRFKTYYQMIKYMISLRLNEGRVS